MQYLNGVWTANIDHNTYMCVVCVCVCVCVWYHFYIKVIGTRNEFTGDGKCPAAILILYITYWRKI